MKYDTKTYTYDTTYDTKTINQNDNLCYSFYNIAQNTTSLFVQTYKTNRYRIIFIKKHPSAPEKEIRGAFSRFLRKFLQECFGICPFCGLRRFQRRFGVLFVLECAYL